MEIKKLNIKIRPILGLSIIFVFLMSIIKYCIQPWWLGLNVDNSYPYLLNSLLIYINKYPHHVDHPGLTTQITSTLFLYIYNCFHSDVKFPNDIINNSEKYINYIINCFYLLYVFCSFLFTYLLSKYCSNLILVLFQISIFAFHQTFYSGAQLCPEIFFIIISLPLSCLIYIQIIDSKKNYIYYISFSIYLCIITKYTFLPYVLIPISCCNNFKDIIKYVLSLSLFLLLFIYFERFEIYRSFNFLINVLSHTGPGYGNGKMQIINFQSILSNLNILILNNIFLTSIILVNIYFVIILICKFSIKSCIRNNVFRTFILLNSLEIFNLILISQHPAIQDHYLMATIVIVPLNILLLSNIINVVSGKIYYYYKPIILILFIYSIFNEFKYEYNYITSCTSKQLKFIHEVDKFADKYNAKKVGYYGCSDINYALTFSSEYSNFTFGDTFAYKYKSNYTFNIWNGQFESPLGFTIPIEYFKLFPKGNILFWGIDNLFWHGPLTVPNNYKLYKLFDSDRQYVYLLKQG